MVKARQQHRGRGVAAFPIPAPIPHPARHTAAMALRFTVQGDDEAETAEGLRLLVDAGLQVTRPPTDTIGNGWMARAVPKTKAPADSDDGRGLGASG